MDTISPKIKLSSMNMGINRIEKRMIEALAVTPLIREIAQRIGWEEALAILRDVNEKEAFQRGQRISFESGRNGLDELIAEVAEWGRGGEWEMDVLEKTGSTYFFNVTKCPYHVQYQGLGLEKFGVEFSCCREKYFAKGFNSNLRLVRKNTIMEGADHCDFRYYLEA
jgi:fumarate reductase iron-sulfur subunit